MRNELKEHAVNRCRTSASSAAIVVADDLVENVYLLTVILKQAGYVVHSAQNGAVALEVSRRVLPDLILLDAQMPEMTGYEVCRQLKADRKTRHIPIIVTSAALEEELVKMKAFLAGGTDFISKPFQRGELLERVASLLS